MHRRNGSLLCAPSDLLRFLGCPHATWLDLKALDEPLERAADDPQMALIQDHGYAHEQAFLDNLKAHYTVTEIPTDATLEDRAQATREALQSGVQVIYQATLLQPPWHGHADFLWRVEAPDAPGGFAYEPVDTKLAKHAAARHAIQLACYADLLAAEQGVTPRDMHLVLGDGSWETLRFADVAYYWRRARARFEAYLADPPADSQPEPVPACPLCPWRERCRAEWLERDHLTQVADIRRGQIAKLRSAGIDTVAALAARDDAARVPGMADGTFARLRTQARLQVQGREAGTPVYERLDAAPGRGFERLPRPSPGDVFFDIEGDPLYPDGLEYLFGLYDEAEGPRFRPFWAHDRAQERQAFEATVDAMTAMLDAYPAAHIYHYAPYETAALRRLSTAHGTREAEVDDLLRRGKLIDLYRVVREAIMVSEPGYSIKNLEVFYASKRDAEVETAGDSIVWYERWRQEGDDTLLQQIADYNARDCVSTRELRDWLVSLRPDEAAWANDLAGADDAAARSAEQSDREAERDALAAAIRRNATHLEEAVRELAGHLLDFHRREDKPVWWAMFERANTPTDDLIEDPECLADLVLDPAVPPEPIKRSHGYTFTFPHQETKLRAGNNQIMVAEDLQDAGEILELDEDAGSLKLKRSPKQGEPPERLSLIPGRPIRKTALENAIARFGTSLAAGDGRYRALEDVLARALPRVDGHAPGAPLDDGSDPVAAAQRLAPVLSDSYLVIQGPPGTGKTFTAARAIVALLREGRRVGITSNAHKAIDNLLAAVEAAADAAGVTFRGVKKAGSTSSIYEGPFVESVFDNGAVPPDADLIAGTAWLFAREEFDRSRDVLVVDEAGQVSLGHLVAAGTAARNLILVGDQMQLPQPTQGSHPGEAGLSTLDYLMRDHATIPPERGLFLATTRRLHPDICRFVSDAVYDGRLVAHPDLQGQQLVLNDAADPALKPTGIAFVDAHHDGCGQRSDAEVAIVRRLVESLLEQRVRGSDGLERPLGLDDIRVVAPYNMQVNALQRALPEGAHVGTVDRFQGQEAEVVIVSMATSGPEDLPRHVEFLYSRNRLNVAVSRARCLAVTVASPRLLDLPCSTVDQVRLVNTLCWLRAYAQGAA